MAIGQLAALFGGIWIGSGLLAYTLRLLSLKLERSYRGQTVTKMTLLPGLLAGPFIVWGEVMILYWAVRTWIDVQKLQRIERRLCALEKSTLEQELILSALKAEHDMVAGMPPGTEKQKAEEAFLHKLNTLSGK